MGGGVPPRQFCRCRERLHTGLRDGCRMKKPCWALLTEAARDGEPTGRGSSVSLLPPVSLSRAPPPGRARQGARDKAETCEVFRVPAPTAALSIINACVWS